MACCAGVFAVEQCYLWLCMDICVNLSLIVTLVITLELEQVLQAVVMHLAIQYCLDLVLLLAINQSCGWGGAGRQPGMGSRCVIDNLTTGNTG
jgi:hypothetical protein